MKTKDLIIGKEYDYFDGYDDFPLTVKFLRKETKMELGRNGLELVPMDIYWFDVVGAGDPITLDFSDCGVEQYISEM